MAETAVCSFIWFSWVKKASLEKKARGTAFARFWLDVANQRNQNTHAKNNHTKYKKHAKMVPKSAKKLHLGSPWAPPGLHKREEAIQTHFGSLFWSILGSPWYALGAPWAATEEQKRAQKLKKA